MRGSTQGVLELASCHSAVLVKARYTARPDSRSVEQTPLFHGSSYRVAWASVWIKEGKELWLFL